MRPRLWLVFSAVGLSAFILGLLGLSFVRVYDDQLIRQTETELIAQGVVTAEAYRALLRDPVGGAEYGVARGVPWPYPVPPGGELSPILPSLRASSKIWPALADPPAATSPADARAQTAGRELTPLLQRVTRFTLSGIRVVDFRGVVVASSKSGLGATLADRDDVRRALQGEPNSMLRGRLADPGDAPLASLSRETGVRVSVAVPVLEGERVWGAVVLSRTPMTFSKALYADRWNLTTTGLVLLSVVALGSLAAAAFVVRPVRALVRQTRAIAANDPAGFMPIGRPVVEELAQLSESLAAMATALRDRNDYIRSFAAGVSHEFKTPLSSIQGAVELLQGSEAMAPEQRERFLHNIDQDARRLTLLVRRLHELARADSLVGTGERVDPALVLASLAERAKAEGLGLSIRGAAPPVRLPAEVLDSVLWQLLANARQHGGAAVQVELSVEVVNGELARFVVQDDGQGISEANRARIFDAFFTTARERGGTGLGLTIARSMLKSVGAQLELLPARGRGAAFAVVAALGPQRK